MTLIPSYFLIFETLTSIPEDISDVLEQGMGKKQLEKNFTFLKEMHNRGRLTYPTIVGGPNRGVA